MLTRVAIFEGTIEKGGEDAFFADVHAQLEPIWRQFPHVLDVRVLRTQQADRRHPDRHGAGDGLP